MKKNTMMRVAGLLLVVVMLTTCAISGTFAKYVTNGTGTDYARVANFGVTVTMADNSNFDMDYKTDETNGTKPYTAELSVSASTEARANVVAPGTGSTNTNESTDGKLVFSITGTPEVATRVTVEMTNVEEIFLVKADGTKYTPVKWTLKQTVNGNGATDVTLVNGGTLADVKTVLDAYSNSVYKPNTKLDATFELTWEWDFYVDDATDVLDTYLGDLAAGKTFKKLNGDTTADMVDGTDYNLEIKYDLKVTVTQIN